MSLSGKTIRDNVMFLLGVGGFIHEVLTTGLERPTILLACLALLGIPVFLRKDEEVAEKVEKVADQNSRRSKSE